MSLPSRPRWPSSTSRAAVLAAASLMAVAGSPLGRPVVIVEDELPVRGCPRNHKGQPMTQADVDAIERARVKRERRTAKKGKL